MFIIVGGKRVSALGGKRVFDTGGKSVWAWAVKESFQPWAAKEGLAKGAKIAFNQMRQKFGRKRSCSRSHIALALIVFSNFGWNSLLLFFICLFREFPLSRVFSNGTNVLQIRRDNCICFATK